MSAIGMFHELTKADLHDHPLSAHAKEKELLLTVTGVTDSKEVPR
jgi:hypothetical protein